MKKIISAIAALSAAAVMTVSTAVTAGAANAAAGELVVLGDSITSGYGLPGYVSGDNYSAPDSFANQLAADFSGCRNFAVDGRTSGELLTALEDEEISSALAGAEVVVISIGGNDFLQPMISAAIDFASENEDLMKSLQENMTADGSSINTDNYLDIMRELTATMTEAANSVDTAGIGQNLRNILSGISAVNPDCRMIVLTVYDPFEGVTGMEIFDVIAREKLALLNSEITSAAAENGAETADVYTAFKGHAEEYTNISSMDIHPSRDGHAVIYSLLSEMIFPAAETMQPAGSESGSKGSPDTGAEGVAVFVGAAAIAAAAALISRRKK